MKTKIQNFLPGSKTLSTNSPASWKTANLKDENVR